MLKANHFGTSAASFYIHQFLEFCFLYEIHFRHQRLIAAPMAISDGQYTVSAHI